MTQPQRDPGSTSTASRIAAAFGDWTPRAVVFDCDGLLLDTESVWEETQRRVIQEVGARIRDDDRRALHGSALETAAALFAERSGTDVQIVERRLHEVFDELLTDGVRTMPGASATLRAVAERVGVGCASNSWLTALEHKLTAGGLREHITVLQASDTVERPKPAPDMYAAAARALGVDPRDALAFEDSATGARAARDAGLRLIAVPAPGDPAPEADLVIDSLEDPALHEWISTW